MAIIFVIFIVAAYTPIRLNIIYRDKVLDLSVNFGKVKIKIPSGKKNKTENKDKKKADSKEVKQKKKSQKDDDFGGFRKFCAALQALYDTSDSVRKTIVAEKLEVSADYGAEDAAFTGMAIGFAYAEVYKLIGFISVIFTVETPKIVITPVFNQGSVFKLEAEGIIKTKAAHIISTALKFYFNYKKALK